MDIHIAHAHSRFNRAEVRASDLCACFCCLGTFSPAEIVEWVDAKGDTALCPKCGVDAVIGSASGVPLTSDFLTLMQMHWF